MSEPTLFLELAETRESIAELIGGGAVQACAHACSSVIVRAHGMRELREPARDRVDRTPSSPPHAARRIALLGARVLELRFPNTLNTAVHSTAFFQPHVDADLDEVLDHDGFDFGGFHGFDHLMVPLAHGHRNDDAQEDVASLDTPPSAVTPRVEGQIMKSSALRCVVVFGSVTGVVACSARDSSHDEHALQNERASALETAESPGAGMSSASSWGGPSEVKSIGPSSINTAFGTWTLGRTAPLQVIHASLLRNGKILVIGGSQANCSYTWGRVSTYLWSPTGTEWTGPLSGPYDSNSDAFCSGHAHDHLGRVIDEGGLLGGQTPRSRSARTTVSGSPRVRATI